MDTRFDEVSLALADGQTAYGRYWCGDRVIGAALYHHGIQSHCAWYEASARALAEAGLAVLQTDRRGCGRNSPPRGHAESAEQLIGDARAARDELLRRSGLQSYHVVGVSWGGKLAAAAYLADPAGVCSLSLVTPGLFPKVGVSREEMARIGMAMIYEPEARFDIPLDNPELFTSAAKWQEFIRKDVLTLRQCTAGFYLASRRMDKPISRLASARPVPLHLFLAGDERIVDNEKTRAFVRGLNWPAVHVTEFPQARHSLEFETIADEYVRKLVSFILEMNG